MNKLFQIISLVVFLNSCLPGISDNVIQMPVNSVNGLILREGPGSKFTKMGIIPFGAIIEIMDTSDTEETIGKIKSLWVKVWFKGDFIEKENIEPVEGWVFGGFIEKQNSVRSITDYKPKNCDSIQLKLQVIKKIDSHDFIHPKFSPDNKKIAYSKVLVENEIEKTEVLYYDFSSDKEHLLIDSKTAEKYMTYSVFVNDIRWDNDNVLIVRLHDGDVESSEVYIDVTKKKIIKSVNSSFDSDFFELSAEEKKMNDLLLKRIPGFHKDVLMNTIRDNSFYNYLDYTKSGLIFQFKYANYADNVRYLDIKNGKQKIVLQDTQPPYEVHGSLCFDNKIVFLISHWDKSTSDKSGVNKYKLYLFLYNNNTLSLLDTRDTKVQGTPLEMEFQSNKNLIFQMTTFRSYEYGSNFLYLFNGNGLKRITNFKNFYDVDISNDGSKIAFCYWLNNKKRVIEVANIIDGM